MKDQRDQGVSHNLAVQAQMTLQATQQLGLTPNIASPKLMTPVQHPQGLLPTASKPGLGFATVLENQLSTAVNVVTTDEPGSLHDEAASTMHLDIQQQQQQTQQQMQQQQQQVHQQHSLQQQLPPPPEVSNAGSLQQAGGIGVKHWQGPLHVLGPKGEEFVCKLSIDAWPIHLSR